MSWAAADEPDGRLAACVFADEAGRDAHLHGQIAAALMQHAGELLSEPPKIEKVDLLAAKG